MTTQEHILSSIRSRKTELEKMGIRQIGLFGSYVRNEQSANSDIDILLDFNPDQENFDNYMAACDLLEGLFGEQKIEIVTKNGLSPYIGPRILNEVKYV